MRNKPEYITEKDWNDVESLPLSEDMLSNLKPVKKNHLEIPGRVRGPQKDRLKIPVSIRLNPEVVEYFKSQGKGWQSQINNILREYIKSHS